MVMGSVGRCGVGGEGGQAPVLHPAAPPVHRGSSHREDRTSDCHRFAGNAGWEPRLYLSRQQLWRDLDINLKLSQLGQRLEGSSGVRDSSRVTRVATQENSL